MTAPKWLRRAWLILYLYLADMIAVEIQLFNARCEMVQTWRAIIPGINFASHEHAHAGVICSAEGWEARLKGHESRLLCSRMSTQAFILGTFRSTACPAAGCDGPIIR